jgi:hypothetical protein
VIVLARSEDGQWYRIRVVETDVVGWVSARLIFIAEGADRLPTVTTTSSGKIEPFLRLRAQEPTDEATDQPAIESMTEDQVESMTEDDSGQVESMTVGEPTVESMTADGDIPAESMTEDESTVAVESMTSDQTTDTVESMTTDAGEGDETFAYRDERWYAMTLGILASAGVIGVGALANIARSLFRRRSR